METMRKYLTQHGLTPGQLTLGEIIDAAKTLEQPIIDVVLAEAGLAEKLTREEVLDKVEAAFIHNLKAVEVGMTHGKSFIMGQCARELSENEFEHKLVEDDFLNKALVYTLAAQVGNHSVGLNPCAGTGDSCPYTGVYRAIREKYGREKALEVAAVMLKVGTLFREGKTSTGCNMEGLGAGAAATAAGFTVLYGGSPQDLQRAVVLAISPTIANPCTPRVMVAGLCAAHIGGAVLIGHMTAKLAVYTTIPVTVPVDVMLAMTAAVHPVSAQHVVPVINKYMRAFFKTNQEVEGYIAQTVKDNEEAAVAQTIEEAMARVKALASTANSIVSPFGEAVVGGSSQAVGSPTNTGRIAHALSQGTIKKVKIELYPELFARRGINVPGVLMGAIYGAHTGDGPMYSEIMGKVLTKEIEVEIVEIQEYQVQRVTVETDQGTVVVDALNRGGGRLVLRHALPSLEKAKEAAKTLGIVVVEA